MFRQAQIRRLITLSALALAIGANADSFPGEAAPVQKPEPATELELFQALAPQSQVLTLEERFDRADWVAMVHVESIGFLVNSGLSDAPKMTAVQGLNYRASVLRNLKGDTEGAIKFRVDLSDCRAPLEVDADYLVFGFTNRHGKLQSFGCEDLIPTLDEESVTQVEDISADYQVARNGNKQQ